MTTFNLSNLTYPPLKQEHCSPRLIEKGLEQEVVYFSKVDEKPLSPEYGRLLKDNGDSENYFFNIMMTDDCGDICLGSVLPDMMDDWAEWIIKTEDFLSLKKKMKYEIVQRDQQFDKALARQIWGNFIMAGENFYAMEYLGMPYVHVDRFLYEQWPIYVQKKRKAHHAVLIHYRKNKGVELFGPLVDLTASRLESIQQIWLPSDDLQNQLESLAAIGCVNKIVAKQPSMLGYQLVLYAGLENEYIETFDSPFALLAWAFACEDCAIAWQDEREKAQQIDHLTVLMAEYALQINNTFQLVYERFQRSCLTSEWIKKTITLMGKEHCPHRMCSMLNTEFDRRQSMYVSPEHRKAQALFDSFSQLSLT